jgi:hypothetical protein
MADEQVSSIAPHFGHLTDPRMGQIRTHRLLNILTIAICVVLVGADGPRVWRPSARTRKTGCVAFLKMSNGIPSPNTFSQVLARLNPQELQQGFLNWFANI